MGQLCFYLPPFSSDYTGVCSTLLELGGMVVIHDGSCCTENYTGYDEPRPIGKNTALYSSALREIDVVTGNDRHLIQKIEDELPKLKKTPSFIALVGTPVPALVGTDLEGIVAELEEETGIPSFGFQTSGMRYYNNGIEQALHMLACRCIESPQTVDPMSVNILGVTPLDYAAGGNAAKIADAVASAGFHVKCSFMMDSQLEDVRHSAEASINLVVSSAGIQLAEEMKQRWGIPYVISTPVGLGTSCITMLRSTVEKGAAAEQKPVREGGLLIIGDQVIANSIRQRLAELGVEKLTVGTFFGLNQSISEPFDQNILSEEQLIQLLKSGKYRAVMGDPLLRSVPGISGLPFFEMAHPAVSGKLHWNDCHIYAGQETEAWLCDCAEKLTAMGL